MSSGRVVGIYLRPARGTPVQPVDRARAVPGAGLSGDHYAGKDPAQPHRGNDVTLIAAEALAAAAQEHGVVLEPGESRRNIVTEGVALNDLVGREFSIGDVRLRGVRLCEPCAHLEEWTGQPAIPALLHRGGLRADLLTEGDIAIGDAVSAD